MRDREIFNTTFKRGLQNFDKYDIINPMKSKQKKISFSKSYKNILNKIYIWRFLVDRLLFSSGITNKATVLFINCNGLSEASEAIINGKSYKSLGVINHDQIKNWESIKGVSNWINVNLTDSNHPLNAHHFAFEFETKSSNDLLHFSFSLLNEKGELIQFISGEKKITFAELTNLSFKMTKILRSEQNGSNISKQNQETADDLKKDLTRLQNELGKKNKTTKSMLQSSSDDKKRIPETA